MRDTSHSRRDVLKLLGATPIIAGAAVQAQESPTRGGTPEQGTPGAAQPAGQGQGGRGGRGRGGFGNVDFWPGLKHLLFAADTQTGYMHDSISHAISTVEQIGRRSNTYMTMIKTDSQLITNTPIKGQGRYAVSDNTNARILPFYDAIFMLPSGYGTMTDEQKTDLLAFVHDEGKGLIVGHAAGVAFTNWSPWGDLIGGYMNSEFNANAAIVVEDPNFPGANAFGPNPFTFYEQHPVFKEPYSRDKVHVIMRLDPDKLDPQNRARRPDGDFAVVWAMQYGKGRVFNVGWGHYDSTWDDPRFQRMMLEAIKWAMGMTPADVTPRPFPGTNSATA